MDIALPKRENFTFKRIRPEALGNMVTDLVLIQQGQTLHRSAAIDKIRKEANRWLAKQTIRQTVNIQKETNKKDKDRKPAIDNTKMFYLIYPNFSWVRTNKQIHMFYIFKNSCTSFFVRF